VLPAIDRVSEQLIERNLPDILSFGHYFHNWFLASIIKHDIPSTLRGVPLSPREVEVLRHVARGLNTDDIAARMNLVSRTVQLHLDSARAKLGAANRQQALALAIKAGFISIA
jgi:DNA-binding NarL/FixJ family response regulator